MTKEEKQLLLQDLCARLPYGVIIEYNNDGCSSTRELGLGSLHDFMFDNAELKPYLRPMSSMTNEERRELCNIRPCYINSDDIVNGTQCNNFIQASECQDWLNANHFDYRGLIPMGLALEALEGMYK